MNLSIARRPIFDLKEQVFAYELSASVLHGGMHEEPTPEELIAEIFLEIGIDRIAPRRRVVLPLDAGLLTANELPHLPPERVVLEIPRALNGDPSIADACRRLRSAGYCVLMHAGSASTAEDLAQLDELARLADVIKIDVAGVPSRQAWLVEHLHSRSTARILAVNVRNRAQRDECIALGFDLVEGYGFAPPETFKGRPVPIEHLLAFRLLWLARDSSVSDTEIEQLLRQDVGLSYRLLRMVRAAGIGAREIWSIGHALRLLGREPLARWLCVLLATEIAESGVRAELVHLALVRARMCERIAYVMKLPATRGPLFLVGMLSVFDQLLEVDAGVLAESLRLAPELREALTARAGFYGAVLHLVENYADGAWLTAEQAARELTVDGARMPETYVEAVAWASSVTSHQPPVNAFQESDSPARR